MIKNLRSIFLAFLILPLFQIKIPEPPKIENQVPKIDTSFATFSDSGLTQATSNFAEGQTIYIKADIGSTQEANINLNLLDSDKNNLMALKAVRDGKVVTANFLAPEKAGIYYLHLEATGSSLSFIGERNINVGNFQTNGVKSETVIKNVINKTNDFSPTPNPTPIANSVKNPILKFLAVFWDKLIVFLKIH